MARVDLATGAVHFYLSDHLGSATVIASQDGSHKEAESDYYPYGVESVIVADTTANHYKFTGKERDGESGLDYFGARFYSSALGRFLTPDWSATPVLVPYATLGNPQTLNLYSYVENNPITGTDPDGHQQAVLPGKANSLEDCTSPSNGSCQNSQAVQNEWEQQQVSNAAAQQSQNTNPVVQVSQDMAIGGGKELANTFIGLSNAVNRPVDALLSNFTSFQFGQNPEYQASTPGESSAMFGVFVVSFFVGTGEARTAAKIESLTAKAEAAYPKLAGKVHEHHIIPIYLGGAKKGPKARIPAAYHQLITNAFRTLAPYGQKVKRTAEEVGRIVQRVYSKYLLP